MVTGIWVASCDGATTLVVPAVRFLMAWSGSWGKSVAFGPTGAACAGSARASADIMTAGIAAVVTATLSLRGIPFELERGELLP
ncbi:hypothetical protein GCM10017708_09190 [Arthrobacter citreus]